jgi:hypothetical protein
MPEVLRAFLSAGELAELRGRAAAAEGWTAGRQGTGYDILPIAERDHPLVARALAQLGTPYEQFWDVYLIRYLDGSHIPAHTDPGQHGKRHRRLNALITPATAGGALRIDGTVVELAPGDAVMFYPDAEVHEVAPVVGTRLLFSVGAWLA